MLGIAGNHLSLFGVSSTSSGSGSSSVRLTVDFLRRKIWRGDNCANLDFGLSGRGDDVAKDSTAEESTVKESTAKESESISTDAMVVGFVGLKVFCE